jgi:hypothetical protein
LRSFQFRGKKAAAAAIAAGLSAAPITALLVEGNNKPGLGYRVRKAIVAAGINLVFCVGR